MRLHAMQCRITVQVFRDEDVWVVLASMGGRDRAPVICVLAAEARGTDVSDDV